MRGIEQHQEVEASRLLRDTRSLGQRVADFYKNRANVSIVMILCAGIALFYPAITEIIFFIGTGIFLYTATREQKLPVRMPLRSKLKDPNDLHPVTKKPNKGSGIAFFGNDRKSNEEVWFANDDLRTHALIFGSTGSGKTESLVSIAFNALVHASGFIYVDGKGDNSLFAKVFSMARGMGREDDILLVNFMTGARDIIGAQEKRLSNTMNPFCTGSSSMLSQLVVSLMSSSSSGGGDGDMWKGRAISFVEALMKILVFMRDRGAILLDANTIRNYFHLEKLEAMTMDNIFPRDNAEPVSLQDVPAVVMEPLKNYVLNLPGYNKERKGKQVSQVLEQHGFITMQLTRTFSSLADTYGHIIRTNLAEVDFKDIVLNRRILVVLLPALEKSPDELANLGKVIIASLKAMMASGLGEDVEGEYRDVIERKPTNAPTPFLCILDEYGYYAVQGFAVVPAQARSLGFSAIFAGQDLPAFQKASKEEAASIGANTNIKVCMKLEDPVETWDFFNKTAGEAYVTKVDSFKTDENQMTSTYLDAKSASFEKRARVDLLDLKEQTSGQAHIFFKSKIIRVSMFYANPKPVKKLRINQFLKVEPPSDTMLLGIRTRMKRFGELIKKGDFIIDGDSAVEEIKVVKELLDQHALADPIERCVNVLLAYHEKLNKADVEESSINELPGVLSVFSPLPTTDESIKVNVDNFDSFSQPLVIRGQIKKHIRSIERMIGRTDEESNRIAEDVVNDLYLTTYYPSADKDSIAPSELNEIIQKTIEHIDLFTTTDGVPIE